LTRNFTSTKTTEVNKKINNTLDAKTPSFLSLSLNLDFELISGGEPESHRSQPTLDEEEDEELDSVEDNDQDEDDMGDDFDPLIVQQDVLARIPTAEGKKSLISIFRI